jgi:RNA polymerase sigma-70 factor (family 1)
MTDQTVDILLAVQIKEGNHIAFATIYDRYHKQLYYLAYRYLKSREMAEDAVQHVFVDLWVNRKKIDETRNVRNFLFVSLKNHTLNIIRDQKRALEKNYEILKERESLSEPGEEIEETIEKSSLIEKAANNLSPQRKRIFYLKTAESLSNQQIANKLNISVNTVKFQYSQILKEIREKLGQRILTLLIFVQFLFH